MVTRRIHVEKGLNLLDISPTLTEAAGVIIDGYFLLPEGAKARHNIRTVNISISARHSCFGNRELRSQNILRFKPKTFYLWTCFPFQLGLNSIPTLTHLAPLSISTEVVDIGAMGLVMVEDVMISLKQKPVLEAFGGLSVALYGLGVAVYAFEGIGMVLPLESKTKNKEKFGKTLGWSMCFISLMYVGFGALGYFAFGDEIQDIITPNLGKGLLSNLVQLRLRINLFFTFPLMMNPVYEVFERRFCGGRYCFLLRWLVVLGVSLVALMVPNFGDFLYLVGSSVCCILGCVLPALFHLLVFKKEMKWNGIVLDVANVILGLVFAVSGTWSSLLEIFSVKEVAVMTLVFAARLSEVSFDGGYEWCDLLVMLSVGGGGRNGVLTVGLVYVVTDGGGAIFVVCKRWWCLEVWRYCRLLKSF
ncbi:hypothetical protein IFM89_035223 [Coptis chinensis]|uniref:Amino acid transporter transmembrane domain-containing protein n=1 Tax=Coptis chinensis TaxID=261450 RepID=A0A835IHI6_9MAGN|nr:hypothetical protein IFM89_035223 [Coptis chinensis]